MFDLIRDLIGLLKGAEILPNGSTYFPITPDGNWGIIFPTGEGLTLDAIRIGRKDGRFYEIRLVDMGGYKSPVVYEEPGIVAGDDGLRFVGKVGITYRNDGYILVRPTKDTSQANDLELVTTTSASKAETVPGTKKAFIRTNLKRIGGEVGVLIERADADLELPKDARWLSICDYFDVSSDARGLAACAKAIQVDPNFRRALMMSYIAR